MSATRRGRPAHPGPGAEPPPPAATPTAPEPAAAEAAPGVPDQAATNTVAAPPASAAAETGAAPPAPRRLLAWWRWIARFFGGLRRTRAAPAQAPAEGRVPDGASALRAETVPAAPAGEGAPRSSGEEPPRHAPGEADSAGGPDQAGAASPVPMRELAEVMRSGYGPPPGEEPGAGTSGDDLDDARILPFVLLHRARMHAVDLRRALDTFRGPGGVLALRRGEVRTRVAFRLDVMVQVAAELVLDGPEVQDKLAAEPEFRRLVHDAVYYLSRHWPRNEPIDLGEKGRGAFAEYMRGRMDDSTPVTGSAATRAPGTVADVEIDFLYDQARTLAQLLSNRGELRRRFVADWRGYMDPDDNRATKELLRSTMGLDGQVDPPLYSTEAEPDLYRWRYDRSGRALPLPAGVEASDPEGDPVPDARFVQAFRWALAELVQGPPEAARGTSPAPVVDAPAQRAAETFADPVGGRVDLATLASEFHVLSPSPAWSEVEHAVLALASPSRPPAAERRTLGPTVRQFAESLRERGEVLALALVAAGAVGQASRGTAQDRLFRGLRVLSDGHRFAGRAPSELGAVLRGVREGLHRVGLMEAADPQVPPLTNEESVRTWSSFVSGHLEKVRKARPTLGVLHDQTEAARRLRVREYLATGARTEPRVEELLLVAAVGEASAAVKLNLAAMTLRDWSSLAFSSLVGAAVEPWIGLAALAALGFRTDDWNALVEWLVKTGLLRDPVDAAGLPTDGATQGLQGVVIVRCAGPSLTEEWMPTPSIPALILTAQEARAALLKLPRRGAALPPLRPPVAVVAFETPLDESDADRTLLKVMGQRLPGAPGPRVLYLHHDRPTDQAKGLYVAAPRGVADLLAEPAPPVAG